MIDQNGVEPADLLTEYGYRVQSVASDRMFAVRGETEFRLRLFPMNRVPSAARIEMFRSSLDSGEVAVFVVPKVSDRARRLVATFLDVGVISGEGKLYLPGLTIIDTVGRPPRPRGRVPWGTFAVIRALLRTEEGRTQIELAQETGLSQGGVSMAIPRIASDNHLDVSGRTSDRPRELWSEFMDEYPGPGGTRTFWYSMAPFKDQVALLKDRTLLSADGAADLIAPWRTPVKIVAYAEGEISMETLGFSPASREESNVELVIPADRTIAATAKAWNLGCVDPVLAAWDVLHVGGNDAEEAHDQLLKFVLEGRRG